MSQSKKAAHDPIDGKLKSDRLEIIERLSRAHFPRIVPTQEPAACLTSVHQRGVVAPVYSEEASAQEMARAASGAYSVDVEVARVSGLWDFLMHCAECGCEGVILDDSYPLHFFNRLSDMDRSRPTLMRIHVPWAHGNLGSFFFSRTGLVDLPEGAAVIWSRQDLLDKAALRFALAGSPLLEPIDAHVIIGPLGLDMEFANGATFLGPYVSDMGANAVFSSEVLAAQFACENGLLASLPGQPPVLVTGYRIERVALSAFLDRLYAKNGPFVDVGLNPLSHRCRQGWFFKRSDAWYLQSLSGVWEVAHDAIGNRSDALPTKGNLGGGDDSEFVLHGRVTVVGLPFKRLFGADRSPVPEEDATLIVERELSKSAAPLIIDRSGSIPADAFVMEAFDKVDGHHFAASVHDDSVNDLGFLVFSDFVAACAFLVHEVLPRDEHIRIHGASLCHGGGVRGSGRQDGESQVTASVVAAIKKTLHDALVRGYRPEHGRHIMRLMRDATATFEVQESGYFGDLLYYGQEGGSDVEDRLDMDRQVDQKELDGLKRQAQALAAQRRVVAGAVNLDPRIASRLRTALREAFELLSEDSKSIAATAVEEFDTVGSRVGYDYAGISMKLAKLVERELGHRLFKAWRDVERAKMGKAGLESLKRRTVEASRDRTESTLIDFLDKRAKLDLGSIRYALSATRVESGAPSAVAMLRDFLVGLRGADWLMGESLQGLLMDISTKYRNGGVHEHLVSFSVCLEAMERILLGADPMLRRLLLATVRKEEK